MRSRNLSFQRGGSRIFRVGIPFIVSLSRFLKSRRRKKKRSSDDWRCFDRCSTFLQREEKKETNVLLLFKERISYKLYIYIFFRVFSIFTDPLWHRRRGRDSIAGGTLVRVLEWLERGGNLYLARAIVHYKFKALCRWNFRGSRGDSRFLFYSFFWRLAKEIIELSSRDSIFVKIRTSGRINVYKYITIGECILFSNVIFPFY